MRPDPASYRDPAGFVFSRDDQIFRAITASGAEHWRFIRDSGLLPRLVGAGLLLDAEEVAPGAEDAGLVHVLRQPRLDFVSHPYEWPFAALRQAALLHLDLHLACLDNGATLIDGSAYNVQFRGSQPVFIDLLSLREYRDGDYWPGHRQFCEQFLNPLLLRAACGVSPAAWYRGALEGIPGEAVARLLPIRWRFNPGVLQHVILPNLLSGRRMTRAAAPPLPKAGLVALLRGLRRTIAALKAKPTGSRWADYAGNNVYGAEDGRRKLGFVAEAVRQVQPRQLWDLGCNTGDAAVTALEAGAGLVIGFDSDADAIDAAFARAFAERRAFLPLMMDMANPSPDSGWRQRERAGLEARRSADMVVALAFLHHLVIGRNIPLPQAVGWLLDLAPAGVLEFVPMTDPMVESMLGWRDRSQFAAWTIDEVLRLLGERAEVLRAEVLPGCGRHLVFYRARP